MGLTLEAEQRLQKAGLVDLFNKERKVWLGVSQKTYDFVTDEFPVGAIIRRDDVQKELIPILEVHEGLREYLDSNKLKGKFWISFFADLIIDRTWDQIRRANSGTA